MTTCKHVVTIRDLANGTHRKVSFDEMHREEAALCFYNECTVLGEQADGKVTAYSGPLGKWLLSSNGVAVDLEFDVENESDVNPGDSFCNWPLDTVNFKLDTKECPVCGSAPAQILEDMACHTDIRVDVLGNAQYTGTCEHQEDEMRIRLRNDKCELCCGTCRHWWSSGITILQHA